MAGQVVDILHELTFEANTDVLQAVNEEFGTQIKQMQELKNKELEYQQLLERTSQSDIRNRRIIEGLLNNTRRQYEQIATAVGRQVAANDRLNTSLQQTSRNLSNLSMAGSQLLREAPAFAFSIQTGILALSNNIPILLDQLRAARVAGSSTNEIFRALGQSVFGLTGLLTIAVSVLTIFGDKLFGSSKAAQESKISIDQVTSSLDKYAKILRDVANLNDEGAAAAKRELEMIRAKSEALNSAFQKEKAVYDGEKALRAAERKDLVDRITLYQSVADAVIAATANPNERRRSLPKTALSGALFQTAGTPSQVFESLIKGLPNANRKELVDAFNQGALTPRAIKERVSLLNQELKALDASSDAAETAFGAKQLANLRKLNDELDKTIEKNEFAFQKLRVQRGEGELDEIRKANEIELRESERQLDREIENAEKEGLLTSGIQRKYEEIRLQIRRSYNEKLLQENIKFFEKEKEDFEKLIDELNKLREKSQPAAGRGGTLFRSEGADEYLKSVNDEIKKGFKQDEERNKRSKELIRDSLDYALNTTVQTLNQIYEMQLYYLDKEISARRERVEQAKELAEKGNTEILESELNRLRETEAERERVAERQLQLNALLQASGAAIAAVQAIQTVTNAGATGDPYGAPVRIAAAVAALAAGFAFVTNLMQATRAGFKDGVIGLDGAGTETSDSIPARLSKGESVMTAAETKKYRPFLEAMRDGTFHNMIAHTASPVVMNATNDYSRLEKKLDGVIDAIGMSGTNVNAKVDERGVSIMTERYSRYERNKWR